MTITRTNHNPQNDSKYARRRSIWKGQRNQLRETIASLHATTGIKVYEYCGSEQGALNTFEEEWKVQLHARRGEPRNRGEMMGHWVIAPPSLKIQAHLPGLLWSDFNLLWKDFVEVSARRVGTSGGAGVFRKDAPYAGESVIVFAPGRESFDLIISKYGFGDNGKRNHHFFQWQARTASFKGLVNIDDYTNEDEGLTFYVAS
jgi:hypothetical protein